VVGRQEVRIQETEVRIKKRPGGFPAFVVCHGSNLIRSGREDQKLNGTQMNAERTDPKNPELKSCLFCDNQRPIKVFRFCFIRLYQILSVAKDFFVPGYL
jgi:hypothetical protein